MILNTCCEDYQGGGISVVSGEFVQNVDEAQSGILTLLMSDDTMVDIDFENVLNETISAEVINNELVFTKTNGETFSVSLQSLYNEITSLKAKDKELNDKIDQIVIDGGGLIINSLSTNNGILTLSTSAGNYSTDLKVDFYIKSEIDTKITVLNDKDFEQDKRFVSVNNEIEKLVATDSEIKSELIKINTLNTTQTAQINDILSDLGLYVLSAANSSVPAGTTLTLQIGDRTQQVFIPSIVGELPPSGFTNVMFTQNRPNQADGTLTFVFDDQTGIQVILTNVMREITSGSIVGTNLELVKNDTSKIVISLSDIYNRFTAINNTLLTHQTQINDLDMRVDNAEIYATGLNNRVTAVETVNTAQTTEINAIKSTNTTQDTRLTAIENINTTQDTRLAGLVPYNGAAGGVNLNAQLIHNTLNIGTKGYFYNQANGLTGTGMVNGDTRFKGSNGAIQIEKYDGTNWVIQTSATGGQVHKLTGDTGDTKGVITDFNTAISTGTYSYTTITPNKPFTSPGGYVSVQQRDTGVYHMALDSSNKLYTRHTSNGISWTAWFNHTDISTTSFVPYTGAERTVDLNVQPFHNIGYIGLKEHYYNQANALAGFSPVAGDTRFKGVNGELTVDRHSGTDWVPQVQPKMRKTFNTRIDANITVPPAELWTIVPMTTLISGYDLGSSAISDYLEIVTVDSPTNGYIKKGGFRFKKKCWVSVYAVVESLTGVANINGAEIRLGIVDSSKWSTGKVLELYGNPDVRSRSPKGFNLVSTSIANASLYSQNVALASTTTYYYLMVMSRNAQMTINSNPDYTNANLTIYE